MTESQACGTGLRLLNRRAAARTANPATSKPLLAPAGIANRAKHFDTWSHLDGRKIREIGGRMIMS